MADRVGNGPNSLSDIAQLGVNARDLALQHRDVPAMAAAGVEHACALAHHKAVPTDIGAGGLAACRDCPGTHGFLAHLGDVKVDLVQHLSKLAARVLLLTPDLQLALLDLHTRGLHRVLQLVDLDLDALVESDEVLLGNLLDNLLSCVQARHRRLLPLQDRRDVLVGLLQPGLDGTVGLVLEDVDLKLQASELHLDVAKLGHGLVPPGEAHGDQLIDPLVHVRLRVHDRSIQQHDLFQEKVMHLLHLLVGLVAVVTHECHPTAFGIIVGLRARPIHSWRRAPATNRATSRRRHDV